MRAACAVLLGMLVAPQTAAEFDFTRHGPIEFLDYLKANARTESVYTIREPMREWVRAEHLPLLMTALDSKEPALPVVLGASSYLPRRSTVGREAAFLIDGYRQRKYPPELSSDRAPDPGEIRRWWQREQERIETDIGRDRDREVIRSAKSIRVDTLDPRLSDMKLEDWVRELVGGKTEVEWRTGDCGLKHDYERPPEGYPLCADVSAEMEKGRLEISIRMGSDREPVSGVPAVNNAWVVYYGRAGKIGGIEKGLGELRRLVLEIGGRP